MLVRAIDLKFRASLAPSNRCFCATRAYPGFWFLKASLRRISPRSNFKFEVAHANGRHNQSKDLVSAIWLFGLGYLASAQKIWHRIGRKSRKVITNRLRLHQGRSALRRAGHEGQEEAALGQQQGRGQDLRRDPRWRRRLHHQEKQEGDCQRDVDLRGCLQ